VRVDCWVATVYWTIAVVASFLYGWCAVAIFKPHIAGREEPPPTSWWWHQRWLNFLGSLVGWLVLWLLIRKFGGCVFSGCAADIGVWDVVGAFVAFIGVTGYLPSSVVSLVAGIGLLAEKFAAWIAGR
jgi:hypothetical protein